MTITINGSGTVTGISAGGLPDGCITAPDLNGAQTGSAPIYGCRAWVNFDGTGTTGTNMTIRGSGNVSSVYKNATGDYTINFTTALPDANFAAVGVSGNLDASSVACGTATTFRATGSVRVYTNNASTLVDRPDVSVTIFR